MRAAVPVFCVYRCVKGCQEESGAGGYVCVYLEVGGNQAHDTRQRKEGREA